MVASVHKQLGSEILPAFGAKQHIPLAENSLHMYPVWHLRNTMTRSKDTPPQTQPWVSHLYGQILFHYIVSCEASGLLRNIIQNVTPAWLVTRATGTWETFVPNWIFRNGPPSVTHQHSTADFHGLKETRGFRKWYSMPKTIIQSLKKEKVFFDGSDCRHSRSKCLFSR